MIGQLTKNFHISEFICRDGTPVPTKYLRNVKKVATELQILRDYLGESIRVLSAYRTPEHNKKVGGASRSYHLTASAADIVCKSKTPKQLAAIIERLIAKGSLIFGGMGIYPGFCHVDLRKDKVRW